MAHTFSLETGPFAIIAEAMDVVASEDPLAILIREEEESEHNAAAAPAPIGQHHNVETSS